MISFTKKEKDKLKKLNTPAKIQDFLDGLRFNWNTGGHDTIRSPLRTLRAQEAHCLEGAILGAYILSLHGHEPLVLHLEVTKNDLDHCIAPFRVGGLWGALSKTNHAVLRYREPVYRDIRELVMSYFHEYFMPNGEKTLRRYSHPLNLRQFKNYEISEDDLWLIDEKLDKIKHYDVAPRSALKGLHRASRLELEAGKIEQYKKQ